MLDYAEYVINKKGNLSSHIKIKGSNRIINFLIVYQNKNNMNKPFIVKKLDVKNILKYPSDFRGANLKNIYNLLKNSKQLFLIESDNTLSYYLVKKVELK